MKLSVAIDGPAGAGKSTIAKLLGEKFNLMYINTGAMYRAITVIALRNHISPENVESLCELIDKKEMHFDGDNILVDGEDLSNQIVQPIISQNVSSYASIPEIRERLVKIQRKISEKYDVIMDGRDIGTVVLKNAVLKLFLTAAPEKRAKRRYDELIKRGTNVQYENVLSDIIKRDYIDSHRKVSPLKKAEDAIEVDSSDMTIDQVVQNLSSYINTCIKNIGEKNE